MSMLLSFVVVSSLVSSRSIASSAFSSPVSSVVSSFIFISTVAVPALIITAAAVDACVRKYHNNYL